MKFKKFVVLIVLSVLLFSIPIYAEDSFDSSNVYRITKLLSSDKYRGRLAGDRGNIMAGEYIAKYFKSFGLKPAGDNGTYFQKFDIVVPFINGPCSFKVFDNAGNPVKSYKYGTDFKEMTFGASVEGTVDGNIRNDKNMNGSIALIEDGRLEESPSQYREDLSLKKSGIKAAIYPTNIDFRFRTPYKMQSLYNDGIVKIMVSKRILPEIRSFSDKNYSFEIKSSVETKKVIVSNIIAKLEGKDKSLPPVILSAHFDHVGFDADNTIYPGAFDNASGTAFLLECARLLKASGQPERTILFIAFNGEEEGLIGSKYFVKHPTINISGAECINFDMVGSSENIPLTILSSESGAKFTADLLKITSPSVKTRILYEDDSDHASFCSSGIKAVTFIHDDITKIHTPMDTIENVDEHKMGAVYKALEAFLKSKGIKITSSIPHNNRFKAYEKIILICGLLLIFLSAFMYLRDNLKNKKMAG